MESEIMDNQTTSGKSSETSKTYVYTIRDWKEYLGESLLIIFSVLFALILTEYFNNLHEKENTKSVLKSIVAELRQNKISIQEMNNYNLHVLAKIDSALVNKDLQQQLVSNDEFHLYVIAPQGALYRYLDNEAWTIAKNNNIMSKVDVETVSILTKVYEDQNRVMKVEDEVANVILNRESRDPNKIHSTLVLIRDIYHGWAVDRTELLLQRIENAIKKVEAY
jgi:uncharacterized protein YlxP (DUF503 family)